MTQRTVEMSCAVLTLLMLSAGLYVVALIGGHPVQPGIGLASVAGSFTN